MSRLSQRQAADQWGVARITLQRAIKDGKVSKDYEGKVDTSELLRVFGEPKGAARSRPSEPEKTTDLQAKLVDLATRNGRLQAENEGLKAELGAVRENLTDLRGEILRLTGPKADPTPPASADPTGRRVLIALGVFTALVIAAIALDLPSRLDHPTQQEAPRR